VDFSCSNIDDGFNGAEERSSKDDGWIILIFSHVNDMEICQNKIVIDFDRDISYYTFDFVKCLVYHLELSVCLL